MESIYYDIFFLILLIEFINITIYKIYEKQFYDIFFLI